MSAVNKVGGRLIRPTALIAHHPLSLSRMDRWTRLFRDRQKPLQSIDPPPFIAHHNSPDSEIPGPDGYGQPRSVVGPGWQCVCRQTRDGQPIHLLRLLYHTLRELRQPILRR